MAELFQVEVEFQLGGAYTRDVDLLESLGRELEELAGEMGPASAILGDRYAITLIAEASTYRDAGQRVTS